MTLPEQLEALSGKVTGRVAVGLLPFSEQDIVVKVFGEMLSRHRHVRLQAVTGSYAALIDGLRQGELNFVVGPLRAPPPYDVLENNISMTNSSPSSHARIIGWRKADAS